MITFHLRFDELGGERAVLIENDQAYLLWNESVVGDAKLPKLSFDSQIVCNWLWDGVEVFVDGVLMARLNS